MGKKVVTGQWQKGARYTVTVIGWESKFGYGADKVAYSVRLTRQGKYRNLESIFYPCSLCDDNNINDINSSS